MYRNVGCQHCGIQGPKETCPACSGSVCHACLRDWDSCHAAVGRTFRLGRRWRLLDISDDGQLGLAQYAATPRLRVVDFYSATITSLSNVPPRAAAQQSRIISGHHPALAFASGRATQNIADVTAMDLRGGELTRLQSLDQDGMDQVAWLWTCPDHLLATGNRNRFELFIRPLSSEQAHRTFSVGKLNAESVEFSPEAKRICIASGNEVRIVDFEGEVWHRLQDRETLFSWARYGSTLTLAACTKELRWYRWDGRTKSAIVTRLATSSRAAKVLRLNNKNAIATPTALHTDSSGTLCVAGAQKCLYTIDAMAKTPSVNRLGAKAVYLVKFIRSDRWFVTGDDGDRVTFWPMVNRAAVSKRVDVPLGCA